VSSPPHVVMSAWRRALLGDNGLPHIGGRLILEDLDAFCEPASRMIGASLTNEAGVDLVRLGAAIGRRQVYERILKTITAPPLASDRPPPPPEPRPAASMELTYDDGDLDRD
jgi:hypothetical protein